MLLVELNIEALWNILQCSISDLLVDLYFYWETFLMFQGPIVYLINREGGLKLGTINVTSLVSLANTNIICA